MNTRILAAKQLQKSSHKHSEYSSRAIATAIVRKLELEEPSWAFSVVALRSDKYVIDVYNKHMAYLGAY